MSGHNFFRRRLLGDIFHGLKRIMCSPFCHEDAARYTNLHKMINNVVTMNMRAHELVSGYIAGIANSDTEFHIKYAPYTFF